MWPASSSLIRTEATQLQDHCRCFKLADEHVVARRKLSMGLRGKAGQSRPPFDKQSHGGEPATWRRLHARLSPPWLNGSVTLGGLKAAVAIEALKNQLNGFVIRWKREVSGSRAERPCRCRRTLCEPAAASQGVRGGVAE